MPLEPEAAVQPNTNVPARTCSSAFVSAAPNSCSASLQEDGVWSVLLQIARAQVTSHVSVAFCNVHPVSQDGACYVS